MKTFPYNYLGICITNKDPEYRGRVKIFIPHIMPALYENWNKDNKDITIECVGDNLQNGLPSKVIQTLEKILPWAECASPLVGASVAGSYSSSSGQFNQNTNGPDTGVNNNANYSGLSLDPGTFSTFGNELQNTATREKLFALMKAEVGSQGAEAQQAWLETVRNRAIVQNTSINNIISNTAYYEPYQNGAFNRASNNLSDTERTSYNGLLQSVLNGSNITNGATHNASAGVAASVKNGGYNSSAGSIVDIGGETYYSKTYEQKGLAKLFENINNAVNINDPADPPETSAVGSVTVPFNSPDGNTTYTDPEGENMQPSVATQTGQAIPATGGGNGDLAKGVAIAKGQVGSIYGTTFGGKCHKATRGLVSAALGVPGHFGSGVGSAKLAIGTSYWTNGGYYEVLYAGGTNKSGYQVQEGDIAVTTGGEHGHAKAVVNGQFRSDNLNDSSANVLKESTEIYRLTDKGKAAWAAAGVGDASLIGQTLGDNPVNNEGLDGLSSAGDDAARTRMVQNTTQTQASPIDSTGMPQGLFSYPNPGALLWVFFREGNPLYPVYFAASYGRNEWQSAHQAGSQPLYYPADGDDANRVVNKSIMRFNGGGMIESNGTVTGDKDYRSMTIAHANGAHLQFHPTGSIQYSPNEHMEQVAGTKYSYRLNSESWTQGTDNKVVLGNQFIKVGNPSQENYETIEELQAKIKEINDIMLED